MKLILDPKDFPQPKTKTVVQTVLCKECGTLVREDRACGQCEDVKRFEQMELAAEAR